MTLKELERRVIKAARGWVNVNDDGTVAGLMRLTKAQTRLGNAVVGYERGLNRAAKRKRAGNLR